MYLFHITFCISLLPNERTQAIPAQNGTHIKPTPVPDQDTDVVAAPRETTTQMETIKKSLLTLVNTDSTNAVCASESFRFFLDFLFFFCFWS